MFSTVGNILSTGEGYHEYWGGVILSIVGDTGGFHHARWGISCISWGGDHLLFEYSTVLNIPMVLMTFPT